MQEEDPLSLMPGQGLDSRARSPCCVLAPLGTCPSSYPQPSLGIRVFQGRAVSSSPMTPRGETSMSSEAARMSITQASTGPACSHIMPRLWPMVVTAGTLPVQPWPLPSVHSFQGTRRPLGPLPLLSPHMGPWQSCSVYKPAMLSNM